MIMIFRGSFYSAKTYFLGFIVGKRITSLIVGLSVSSITSLSTPMPRPPVGGRPYSSAVTKSSSTCALQPGSCALFSFTCFTKRSFWSMGSLSSENALPNSLEQMKYSNLSVNAGSEGLRFASGEFSTG